MVHLGRLSETKWYLILHRVTTSFAFMLWTSDHLVFGFAVFVSKNSLHRHGHVMSMVMSSCLNQASHPVIPLWLIHLTAPLTFLGLLSARSAKCIFLDLFSIQDPLWNWRISHFSLQFHQGCSFTSTTVVQDMYGMSPRPWSFGVQRLCIRQGWSDHKLDWYTVKSLPSHTRATCRVCMIWHVCI